MKPIIWLLSLSLVAASCDQDKERHEVATGGTLTLVRERDLSELLPSGEHYEASGLAFAHGSLRVVFDNLTKTAEVDLALTRGKLGPGGKSTSQYEGITVASRPAAKFYVVKEVGAAGRGAIVTLDEEGSLLASESTDIAFADTNKGLEGIAWLDDIERLLVLCEGNSCGEGEGKTDHGIVKALRREAGAWVTETTLSVPPNADFSDYADLAVFSEADGSYRIAILSQEASALWIGTLTTKPLAIAGPGVVYGFPRPQGKIQYCALEGVTFVDRTTLALASDRGKDEACKSEALHIFAIP